MFELFKRNQRSEGEQIDGCEEIEGVIERISMRPGIVGLSGYVTSYYDVLISGTAYFSDEGTKNLIVLSLARPGDTVRLIITAGRQRRGIAKVVSVQYNP
jgi:hypothetical protein